jgi:hypothetical protein
MPVRLVLLLEPARAQAEFDSAAQHLVDLGDLDGEHAGQPERSGGYQGAEADSPGLPGQTAEGDPGIGGAGHDPRTLYAVCVYHTGGSP